MAGGGVNFKPMVFGIVFDSGIERDRYLILRAQLDAGEITALEPHPAFDITPPGQRRRRDTADFRYRDSSGHLVVEEVKPKAKKAWSRRGAWRLRMDLAASRYPDHQFIVVEM